MTVFRFILAFVTYKPSQKLKALMIMQLAVSLIVIFFVEIMGMKTFAIYIASIFYGISFSAMFGLFFVLPTEYGMEVTCA